jgi:hypothetical protein
MTRVIVDPGICGFSAVIEVEKLSKLTVKVKITSKCEKVSAMGNLLSNMKLGDALKSHVYSAVYQCASESKLCPSCPIPVGILKAVEVEAGLALPRPVVIQFKNATQS